MNYVIRNTAQMPPECIWNISRLSEGWYVFLIQVLLTGPEAARSYQDYYIPVTGLRHPNRQSAREEFSFLNGGEAHLYADAD